MKDQINFCLPKIIAFSILMLIFLISKGTITSQDVSDLEKRLQKIREEINLLEMRIKEEKNKEATILAQLNQLSLEKRLVIQQINLNTAERQKLDREITSLKREIENVRQKMMHQKNQMERTLVSLYKYGHLDWLRFFFQADSLSAIVAENKRLQLLLEYQNSVLSEYLRTENRLKELTNQMMSKQEELQSLYQSALEKKKDLEEKENNLKQFSARIQQNRQLYEQTLKEYKERADQLQNLMDKIINQELTLPFPFVPFYERKGKLIWPISGKVITSFGLQKHPRFNTITFNNGIEIAPTSHDRTIKAIHAGKVVYADTFQGYGDLLIIDHGLNYFSLYGHCAEFLVTKGDWVKEGQPIALVGDTGSLKGICLYFEIRYKTKALDPLQWLRKR